MLRICHVEGSDTLLTCFVCLGEPRIGKQKLCNSCGPGRIGKHKVCNFCGPARSSKHVCFELHGRCTSR